MTGLLWNVLLALVWAAITGTFTPPNLLFGFVLGFVILLFARRVAGSPIYAGKLVQVIALAGYFLWELFLANLRVAFDVITPRAHMRPGVIAIPLDVTTDTEITILANLISLTPGTLSLDVSADRRTLYIHAMYLDDVEEVRRRIKTGFERRLMAVMR
jgi:multicomponent Na+:H+ antiporter subunit E